MDNTSLEAEVESAFENLDPARLCWDLSIGRLERLGVDAAAVIGGKVAGLEYETTINEGSGRQRLASLQILFGPVGGYEVVERDHPFSPIRSCKIAFDCAISEVTNNFDVLAALTRVTPKDACRILLNKQS